MGSGQLARSLQVADLVDEYRLWLHPVVLGGGKRLFREGGPPASFRLADSQTTSGGLVILTYQAHVAVHPLRDEEWGVRPDGQRAEPPMTRP